MTPEQLQELSNSISDLRQAVNQMSGSSSLMASSFARAIQGMNNVDPALRRMADGLQNSVNVTKQAGNAIQQEQQIAAQTIKNNARDTVEAMNGIKAASRSMVSSLMSTTTSLSNLASVGNAAGQAVRVLGVKMGMADSAAGKLADALGSTIRVALDQTQAFLSAKDSLAKLGAAGNHTVNSLYAYAHAAGLHSDSINYMITPMRQLGSSIMALGRGAGDAQKAFMEMLQVSSEERERFARLGIMQEEMMQRQADYVALQGSSASNMRLQNMDMQSLRKASLEYVRNLYDLAALTGQQVDQVKDQQQAALMERRIMLETLAKQAEAVELRKRADELEKTGTPEGKAEADALRRQADELIRTMQAERALIQSLGDLPQNLREGITQAMTTGGIPAQEAETLARMGVLDDILQIVSDMRNSQNPDPAMAGAQIREVLSRAGLENLPGIVKALQVSPDDQLAKAFGYDLQTMPFYSQYAERQLAGPEGELAQQRANRIAAEQQGIDAASDLQAALQNLSINLNQVADNIVAGPNPLIQNFNLLKDSAQAASIALDQISGRKSPTTGQEFGQGVVDTLQGTADTANWFNQLASDPAAALGNLWNKVTGQEATQVPASEQRGGESTLGRQQPTATQAAPTQAPVTQAPVTQAPVTQAEPTQTPAAQAPAATATPAPTYQPITVDTNLGNKITLNGGAVGKLANELKQGKNRDQLRNEVRKIIGSGSYNDVTIDKIIDKVSNAAGMPILPGSAAEIAVATPGAAAPATPLGPEQQVTPPTAQQGTQQAPQTAATPTTERPAAVATPKPEEQFVPSTELKNWIRSQIRLRKRRDAIRDELIKQGYTPTQADMALNAELGQVPTATPDTKPPTTATPVKPETATTPGTKPQPARPQTGTAGPQRPQAPVDYDPSTPNIIDTVSPEQQNWMRVENDLRARLSDLVRNKKTLTRDQANQILDYYDTLRDKPGAIPTVDQIIQNSGVMRQTTTSETAPAGVTGVKPPESASPVAAPSTAPSVAANLQRKPPSIKPPQAIAQGAGYRPTEPGNINTNLAGLLEYGIPAQYVRGNKTQEPLGGDTNDETFDTHGEGAQVDPRLLAATMQLISMNEGNNLPIKISHITALNDYYHNTMKKDSQHTKGRAIDFTLEKKPTEDQFTRLQSILQGIGFDKIDNEYVKKSADWTGPHIHAQIDDPKPMAGDNFTQPGEIFQAAMGGIVSGSKSGFPAILHGSEIVVPLDPNSMLAELGKKSQDQIKTEMSTFEKSIKPTTSDSGLQDISRQNQQLMEMLSGKLDSVINILDTSNYTQEKILKYSQV